MRRFLHYTIVVGLAVGLMAFFLRNAQLDRVAAAVAGARWGLIVVAIAVTILSYVMRVVRWRYLLRPVGQVRFSTAFRATVMGFAATALVPGRLGEVVRPYVLARKEDLSASSAFATIVVERLLDMSSVMLIFLLTLGFDSPVRSEESGNILRTLEWAAVSVLVIAVSLLMVASVAALKPALVELYVSKLGRLISSRLANALARMSKQFAVGFGILHKKRDLVVVAAWSFVLWASLGASVWLVTVAFGIDIPGTGVATLLALVSFGVVVPTPGGVGGYHAAYQLGATALYGASQSAAIGAAFVLHGVTFLPITILGIVFMMQEGIGFSRLRSLGPIKVDGTDAFGKKSGLGQVDSAKGRKR